MPRGRIHGRTPPGGWMGVLPLNHAGSGSSDRPNGRWLVCCRKGQRGWVLGCCEMGAAAVGWMGRCGHARTHKRTHARRRGGCCMQRAHRSARRAHAPRRLLSISPPTYCVAWVGLLSRGWHVGSGNEGPGGCVCAGGCVRPAYLRWVHARPVRDRGTGMAWHACWW